MDATTETAQIAAPPLARRDACAACGARLAGDQRYCVECGERQAGAPIATQGSAAVTDAPPVPVRRPRVTMSSGATLIAGVATLLVAMGVGVLIGRSSSPPRQTGSAPVRVVNVPAAVGAATAAPTAAPGTTKAAAGKGKRSGARGGKAAAKKGGAPKKLPVPASETKQAPGSDKPPPAVQVGSPGHGKGYKNGHFTGDFFGP